MIAVVVLVFLMWGPKKIPELARSLGLARKEFADASKVGASPLDSITSISSGVSGIAGVTGASGGQMSAPTQAVQLSSGVDGLIETAKRLGLPTEGKTREEVSNEILQRAQTARTN
jgi:sec-independent protein translocase protein TatA